MKKLSLIFFCLLLMLGASAQDIHFSQFNETPSLINPALTGINSAIKASVIYRNQWSSITVPYKTYGATVEMRFRGNKWDKQDEFKSRSYKKAYSRMAGGLSFFSDKAGDGNMGSTQVNGTIASYVPINKNSNLSVGLQASLVQRKVDFSKLVFPDQYTGSGSTYDANIDAGENFQNNNFIYPDFGAGVVWSYGYEDKMIGSNEERKANAGISVYHLNQPKQKYLAGTDERLNAKFVLHGDFLVGIKNTNVAIAPAFLVELQNPSTEIVVGSLIKYYLNDESKYTGFNKKSAIGFGVFYRYRDAVILSSVMEIKQYAIGLTYDISASNLTRANLGRGGFEVFLRVKSSNPFLFQNN